ncbi:MAG: hypothetical protein H7Z21_06705 [Hymenobacter sp.]|nr:hypothetical protein [Hymenobacter sp.]
MPVLVNTVAVLVVYGLIAVLNTRGKEIALFTFVAMCALLLLNTIGLITAFVKGWTQTAIGLIFSILGICLIGLGSCAQAFKA